MLLKVNFQSVTYYATTRLDSGYDELMNGCLATLEPLLMAL